MAEKRSLVVGGFHVTESTDKHNKVPLLGDIPLLGKALFSSTERQNNRRERLFILTPRVIGDQADPRATCPRPTRPNCRRPSRRWRVATTLTSR
jgi:type III secretion protein C